MNNLKPYTNYKPSNIAWLGDIPEHWEVIRLRFLSKITTGNKNTEDRISLGKYNFYVRSQKIEKINSYSFEGEGILTAGDGVGVGKVFHYVNEKFDFHQRVYLFYKFPDFVHGKYLFYYLRSYLIIDLMLYNAKSTVDSVRLPTLKDFGVSIPSKEEQTAIANFLDYKLSKIDRFIQKKKQLIKLLNEQKAGIINDAVTKGLDPNAKMKPSGIEWLGDIPEHWEVRRTKVLFKLVTEFAPLDNDEELLSLYTDIGVKPRKDLVAKGNKASSTDNYWIVKKGDIIVNKLLAWMGAVGISEYDGVTSPAYDILRGNDKVNPYFYHYLFRNPKTFREFKRHSRGIMDMRLRLYFSELGDIKLPLPSLEEQRGIVSFIEEETSQINTVIQTIEKEIALVQEYRVAIIAEAVTGKIDVRDYEIPETPVVELYEELEDEMSLAAEDEVGYLIEN